MNSSHGELAEPPVRYSFYRRSDTDGLHYVVNYIAVDRWLQLDMVFADRWRWFRIARYEGKPPVGVGIASMLKPRKVASAVLSGVRLANSQSGTRLQPKAFWFAQTDFEAYGLYEAAATHLVRHVAEGGQFSQLLIIGPDA